MAVIYSLPTTTMEPRKKSVTTFFQIPTRQVAIATGGSLSVSSVLMSTPFCAGGSPVCSHLTYSFNSSIPYPLLPLPLLGFCCTKPTALLRVHSLSLSLTHTPLSFSPLSVSTICLLSFCLRDMPGQGSTSRECVACRAIINVACKTCKICKAGQPHKLRLKKKLAKFDEKRESWVQTHQKNRTVSHIQDEANILLEKLQALGVRAMLFAAKPGKKQNTWVSEVLAPRCHLSANATACVDRMKDLYGFIVHDWVPQDATGPSSAPVQPPVGPVAPPDPQQTPVSLEKDDIAEEGCPAPSAVLQWKRKENMAAASPSDSVASLPRNVVIKTEPEAEDGPLFGPEDVPVKREPVVQLMAPVSGLQPLAWSQDHRLAVCTSSSLALMELVCDVHSNKQDLTLHRTSIPIPTESYKLRVGPAADLAQAMEKFSTHPDPAVRQVFLADRVMNPSVGVHKGIKYASWSPLGCDSSGRCLLACLTLDHRLTIHNSHKRLEWNMLVDLTKKYSERLKERGYAKKDNKPPQENLLDFDELQRRFRMQTPLRMEWSSVYTIKQVQPDNACKDMEMVLLAVLMENGDLVLWKFVLPFTNGADVMFYDIVESGVTRPSDLAWWEYESADRRMSGLIVGSEVGPVKIMPVSLSGVKGYFTLRHPVILWKECDEIAVENIKCVPMIHPIQKSKCSLIVASRGCYVFWCLLMISPAGLNVHNSHVAGLHSLPVVSLAVSQHGVAVYTCSIDGWIKKLTPTFTENTLIFKQEDMSRPENITGRRIHGIAVSHNGAYIALASTQGMVGGYHPINRTYQVHFVTLKTPEMAAALLLKSPTQNLYKLADLLDLVRWQILKNKCIPASLLEELDQKIQEVDSPYLWRFKLFLVRMLYQSLQTPPTDHCWKPTHKESKVFVRDEEEEDGQDEEDAAQVDGEPGGVKQEASQEEQMAEVQAWINAVETHLMRENIKKVLGVVYLNTWIAQNTSIPTCGLVDYLSRDPNDRASEVLIGHIKKKMNKQTFSERCSLCQEVLPFSDHKQAICKNGHMWLRCVLSYQACQTLTFRRCLLLDSIARLPEPEDPEWIKKILQAPCTLCDSPMI